MKLAATFKITATKETYAASETPLGTGGPYGAVPGAGG
jgi:hypothetical protein